MGCSARAALGEGDRDLAVVPDPGRDRVPGGLLGRQDHLDADVAALAHQLLHQPHGLPRQAVAPLGLGIGALDRPRRPSIAARAHDQRRRSPAMSAIDDTRLYTVSDVGDQLKISRAKVYDLIRTRQLRSITIGRSRRVTRPDLHDYLHHRTKQGA
jgi:excisionase family DNA binding protein